MTDTEAHRPSEDDLRAFTRRLFTDEENPGPIQPPAPVDPTKGNVVPLEGKNPQPRN